MSKVILFIGGLLLASTSVEAISLTCAEDKKTDAQFCFAVSEIREADGIRTAPFYRGGPKGIDKTPYHLVANCKTGVLHLKDQKGVSFGGAGAGGGTAQSRNLRRIFCEAALPKKKS